MQLNQLSLPYLKIIHEGNKYILKTKLMNENNFKNKIICITECLAFKGVQKLQHSLDKN